MNRVDIEACALWFVFLFSCCCLNFRHCYHYDEYILHNVIFLCFVDFVSLIIIIIAVVIVAIIIVIVIAIVVIIITITINLMINQPSSGLGKN